MFRLVGESYCLLTQNQNPVGQGLNLTILSEISFSYCFTILNCKFLNTIHVHGIYIDINYCVRPTIELAK